MFFRTAGFQPAHDHDAGWKPAIRKTMTGADLEVRVPEEVAYAQAMG